jgi:hypothetical protein
VVVDVSADDVEATGLLFPAPRVESVRIGVVRGGLTVVVLGGATPADGGLRDRRGVVAEVLGLAVLARAQSIPDAGRPGRERRRRVRRGQSGRTVVAAEAASIAEIVVRRAVSSTHGVTRISCGAVGPPLGLGNRTGAL